MKRIIEKYAKKISNRNRRRKYDFFERNYKPGIQTRILDVGFTDDINANNNSLEWYYPHKKNITALGIEDPKFFSQQFPDVNVILYDGNIFPFTNKSFDIVWSNAVIEHVGGYEKQKLFLSEAIRTGKRIFITTPNRWFPFEVHTRLPLLHYLPKRIFDKILTRLKLEWATGDYMNLLSVKDMKKLLSDAGIKEYTIVRNRLFFFTLDFMVIV
jgi:SAM-dependent methyltransferase